MSNQITDFLSQLIGDSLQKGYKYIQQNPKEAASNAGTAAMNTTENMVGVAGGPVASFGTQLLDSFSKGAMKQAEKAGKAHVDDLFLTPDSQQPQGMSGVRNNGQSQIPSDIPSGGPNTPKNSQVEQQPEKSPGFLHGLLNGLLLLDPNYMRNKMIQQQMTPGGSNWNGIPVSNVPVSPEQIMNYSSGIYQAQRGILGDLAKAQADLITPTAQQTTGLPQAILKFLTGIPSSATQQRLSGAGVIANKQKELAITPPKISMSEMANKISNLPSKSDAPSWATHFDSSTGKWVKK